MNVLHPSNIALPLELCYVIIEHTFDAIDSPSVLRTCCLVCRAWMHYIRPRLFKTIVLRNREEAHKYFAIPWSSKSLSYFETVQLHETPRPPYAQATLILLARQLPNVKRLSLLGINQPGAIDPSGFLKVTRLVLQRAHFESSTDLINFLSSFPQLTALELGVRVLAHNFLPQTNLSPPPRLSEMDVDELDAFLDIMSWMTASHTEIHLTKLTVPVSDKEDHYVPVGEFLKACRSLEHLRLQWHIPSTSKYESTTQIVNDHIDLSVNTSLKHLHLDLICVFPGLNLDFSWIPTTLSQVVGVLGLEEVSMSIVFRPSVSILDSFPWAAVEDALVILSLQRSSWAFLVHPHLQTEAKAYAKGKLPALQAKGLLEFIDIGYK